MDMLIGKTGVGGPKGFKKDVVLDQEKLEEFPRSQWWQFALESEQAMGEIDRKTQSLQEIAKLLPHFFKLLETAKEKGLRGEYPFITPQFIQNVLLNLQSTYWAYEFEFNTYRQKAIIRNLTD